MNDTFQHQTFTLVRFEPSNIILQHNGTKKLYRYAEVEHESLLEEPNHQLILKAERLCSGFVYEKELTTLAKEIKPRVEATSKTYFEENELNNTFEPILLYLQRGGVYNVLSLQNILIDHQGSMRLQDPRLVKTDSIKMNAFQRLGQMILQCALLRPESEIAVLDKSKMVLSKALTRFSSKFVANVWIMVNNCQPLIKEINLSQKEVALPEYKNIIEEIERLRVIATPSQDKKDIFKSAQQKRIVVIPPLNLKFNKTKKPEIKLDLSGKSRLHNENQNEESLSKIFKKTEMIQKIINFKCQTNKNIQQKNKAKQKKSELIENRQMSSKKKGKTVGKKLKFQQRSN